MSRGLRLFSFLLLVPILLVAACGDSESGELGGERERGEASGGDRERGVASGEVGDRERGESGGESGDLVRTGSGADGRPRPPPGVRNGFG